MRFNDFQQKRMKIFGEVVKKYWNGELQDNRDLNELAENMKVKFELMDEDIPFIKDHIRVAMGLDPRGDTAFEDEINIVKNSKEIKQPIVAKIEGACEYCDEDCKSKDTCGYEAQIYRRSKGPVIINDKCLSCGQCVTTCDFGALTDKIEFIPLVNFLKNENTPVYATVAPAMIGQFGEDVTMGQLRTALKLLGFKDMIEVALFADILTIKEAFEFNHLVKSEEDFFLTSCCCPVWFNLVKKNYPVLFEHMPPSVSPMIASGRVMKKLDKEAKVVFIAPCIAKKAEAKAPGLQGNIDFVLNFRELQEIFEVLKINVKELPSDEKDQASFGGRVYARTGGVSFAVKTAVNRLDPTRLIKLKAKKVDGVKACKQVLDELSMGKEIDYNFVEGMGCEGGCVGGPRTNIDREKATDLVNGFGEDSLIMTPFDNINVMKILKQFGIGKIEEIIQSEEISKVLERE